MRISARLDSTLANKIRHLMSLRREKISDIIKASLEHYYEHCMEQADSAGTLEQSGFIGCAEGPEDLSQNYKQYLREDLDEKFSHRSYRILGGPGQFERPFSLPGQNRSE